MKKILILSLCLFSSACSINRNIVRPSETSPTEEIVTERRQLLFPCTRDQIKENGFGAILTSWLLFPLETVLFPVWFTCEHIPTTNTCLCGRVYGATYTRPKEAFPVMTSNNQELAPKLSKALSDSKPYVRRGAAKALGEIGPGAKDAVPELGKALSDSESAVRREAAKALGEIGPDAKDAVPELGKALNDSEPAVRRSAVEALGKIGPNSISGVPALVKALTDSNSDVRCSAAKALGEIGANAESAIPNLVTMLDATESSARINATEALSKIGPLGKAELEKREKRLELERREKAAAEEIRIKLEKKRLLEEARAEQDKIHKAALSELSKIASYAESKGCVFALAMIRYPYGRDPYRISNEYLCVFNGSKGAGTINERAGCAVVNLNGQTGEFNLLGGLPIHMLDGQACSKRTVQELLNSDHYGDIDVKRIAKCATNVLDMGICPARELASGSGREVHLDFVAVSNEFHVSLPSDIYSLDLMRWKSE